MKKEIFEAISSNEETFETLKEKFNINDELLSKVLASLEYEKLITRLKSGIYKSNTKKKNIVITEYNLNEDYILDKLNGNPVTLSEAARLFGAALDDTRYALEKLVSEGKIVKVDNFGLYYVKLIEAELKTTKNGSYFVIVDDNKYNIEFLTGEPAFRGDLVNIFIDKYDNTAILYSVKSHYYDYVVGVIKEKKKKTKHGLEYRYTLVSTMPDLPVEIKLNNDDLNGIVKDSIVKADIKYISSIMTIKNLKVVGNINDPNIDITKIALEYGFNLEFEEDTLKETEEIPNEVLPNEYNGRRDLRDLDIITIDGDDSKDFDDAVYLEILPNGNYSLGVHIADVSHYVKFSHPLDKEALKRGTSVYLADRVIPMLPHKLSNGICSLNESVDRLALSCQMEIDSKGNLVNYEIFESVINSHHRMTYNKVNKILDGDKELIEEYNDIYDMLIKMRDLSNIIRGLRMKKGGIEFDTVEYSFKLDKNGKPIEIIKRDRLDAEKLIEDFMLKANETVAYHMNIMGLPIIYRIHEKPDQEKLHNTFKEIANMGVDIKNIKNDIHPKEIQNVLSNISDNPNKDIISNMLLRSMMKAKYSNQNIGHYGLALNYYCHFTSPIRRYPDLMTHRMIKELLIHPSVKFEKDLKYYNSIMLDIAMKNSSSERRSVDCERSVNDMLYAWYMESNINKEYTGVITSITSFGMFIELNMGIEGLFLFRNANKYYYVNDKDNSCETANKIYHLGDRVDIIVTMADREERCIYFALKDDTRERY